MNGRQDLALSRLLAAWRRRENARSSHDVEQLANARFALDSARAEMRSTLSPTR